MSKLKLFQFSVIQSLTIYGSSITHWSCQGKIFGYNYVDVIEKYAHCINVTWKWNVSTEGDGSNAGYTKDFLIGYMQTERFCEVTHRRGQLPWAGKEWRKIVEYWTNITNRGVWYLYERFLEWEIYRIQHCLYITYGWSKILTTNNNSNKRVNKIVLFCIELYCYHQLCTMHS